MEPWQAIGYGVAAFFFSWACFFILKATFKFGEPYSTLREEMEQIRGKLGAEIKAGKYTEERLSSTIASFNREAKRLRMPEFERES